VKEERRSNAVNSTRLGEESSRGRGWKTLRGLDTKRVPDKNGERRERHRPTSSHLEEAAPVPKGGESRGEGGGGGGGK